MKYHRVPIPIQLDWLASDRPPLQTAMVLSQYFALIWPINMGYQVLCMLLQSLWLFGLWLLLSAFELNRSARSLILAGCLFSSFVFVNTAFVWPKLVAAAYFLGMLALLVGGHVGPGAKSRTTMTVTAGVLLTWSLLAHGGTVFALGGLAFLAFCYRRSVSGRSVAVFVSAVILLYLPWTLYQKLYDPPGNRLLKMHLAGVDPIDKRGVFQTLSDSYRALTMRQIADYKRRNLEEAFVYLPFWPLLRQLIFELPRKEPARSQALVAIAHNLNAAEFFSVSSTAGLLLPGLAFLGLGVWPRFRSNEWRAGVILLGFTVSSNVFWSLVMFGPETTVVHQGAYAVILAYMAASILGWWTMSRWAALVATLLEVGLFVYTNAFLIVPSKATLHFDVLTLLFLALAGTVYLIIRLGKSEASQTVVEAIPSSDALTV